MQPSGFYFFRLNSIIFVNLKPLLMFQKIVYRLLLLNFSLILMLSSCAPKEDTTDPVILLKGNNPYNVDSIGGSFTDPGYTAVDDNDGDITDRVVVQYPLIGKDSARSYQIFYRVMDNAGNTFTTYRTVNIRNTAAILEGIYNNDTLTHLNDTARIYQSTITSSLAVNGDFTISNFANKGFLALVNGRLDFSGNLTFQTPVSLMDSDSTVITNITTALLILLLIRSRNWKLIFI